MELAPYDLELKAAGQLTSATWELELFLSGAFVFSSFQLPGLIEGAFRRLDPFLIDSGTAVLSNATLYGKAIAFTLILTFSIHLVARALWVALLGLHSVFPNGIRWEELKTGPITRELYMRKVPNLGTAIARLDNFCSITFSTGLLIVVVFVFSVVMIGSVAASAYLLARLFTGGRKIETFFFILIGAVAALPLLATVADKRFGSRLAPDSRGYRVLRAMVRLGFMTTMIRATGPMMWTLSTNIGRKRAVAFIVTATTTLIILSSVDRLIQSDRLSLNSNDFFASSRNHGIRYQHYESQRDPEELYPKTPSIQSDIIKDPYVKLFIPYQPARHNIAIVRACPTLKPLQDRGIQLGSDPLLEDSLVTPVLECMARMHAVTLDGIALSALSFAFYEHPGSGIKGILAYIPVDSLPRGRHVIGVIPVPPPVPPKDSSAAAAWKRPTLIPFWR